MISQSRARAGSRLLAAAAIAFAIGCGGDEPPAISPTTPGEIVASVQITTVDPRVEAGSTVALTATVLDGLGKPIAGKVVTWSSSNTAVAKVDPVTGVVQALTEGSALITVHCESKVAAVGLTVTPLALTSVAINTSVFTLVAGQAISLTTTLKDRTGAVVTGRALTWSSSATRVAVVDANGLVTALSAGTALITATAEGLTGSVSLTIMAPEGTVAPSITAVAPATLSPGGSAIITGANFASGAGSIVYIDGVEATVTASTPTQITATISRSYGCVAAKPVKVEVITPAGAAGTLKSMQFSTVRTLAVGESFLASDASSRTCNELPATGTYVVSVFNASTTSSAVQDIELRGSSAGATSSLLASLLQFPRTSVSIGAPARRARAVDPAMAAAARAHATQLQFNLATIQRLGSARKYRRAPHVAASLVASPGNTPRPANALAAVPTTVGDTARINFLFNTCAIEQASKITARVVYVGAKAIVLEDNAAPLAGKVDDDLIALAKEWETVSYPLLVKNLADPLAYDAQTDGNGRIIMMFTPLVNNLSPNLLGFVSSCDFYPPSASSGTNQAEIFYARAVTDTSATSTTLDGRPGWRRQMPATIVHETKHIASFAERFAAPVSLLAGYEQVWLEEATAQLASELYARAIHGNSWRSNAGYAGILECELRPADPACNGAILAMWNNFGWLERYLVGFEGSSLISNGAGDGATIYGGAWMFMRWLVDTYGGNDEGAFMSSIVKNFEKYGVANVVQKSGKSWAELLSQFTLMLAVDDVAGAPAPFIEPSWNLPAVWLGYNAVRSEFHAKPLVIRETNFGTFQVPTGALKGGSAVLVRLGGGAGLSGGTQLLHLQGFGGVALPPASAVGIAVLRIQ